MHQGALPFILSGGSPGEEIERRQTDSSLCPPLQAYSTVLSLPSTSEEIRLSIVSFWLDDYENEWCFEWAWVAWHPRRGLLSIVGFWPSSNENEWCFEWAWIAMKMNDVLNEHELQDTPEEAPLRILGFWPRNNEDEMMFWMSMSAVPPKRFCFTLLQFLRRGSALHLCSSSEEVLLCTCAVPPKRFCFNFCSSPEGVLPSTFVQFPPKRVQFHLVLDFGSLKNYLHWCSYCKVLDVILAMYILKIQSMIPFSMFLALNVISVLDVISALKIIVIFKLNKS